MAALYTKRIVLTVQGLPIIHCRSARPRTRTGKQLVKGMSPDGAPIGNTDGSAEHTIDLTVYIPKVGDIPWAQLEEAVLTITPASGGVPSVYSGGFVTEVGESYSEDDVATRDITMMFTRKL